jgi:hypothetical protein
VKLNSLEMAKLLDAAFGNTVEHEPIAEIIGDACELLTAKIVVRLRAKARKLEEGLSALEPGSIERAKLASQINALSVFAVELSELE